MLDTETIIRLVVIYILFYTVFWFVFVCIPLFLIIRRMGLSKWISLITYIPIGGLLVLWYLAITEWPNLNSFDNRRNEDLFS